MKKTVKMFPLLEVIQKFALQAGGVFSTAELCNLLGLGSDLKNFRMIQRLVREEVLFQVQRGFYVVKGANLWRLASRLNEKAYISMDSVLARNGLIGTLPERSVSLVQLGRNRSIETPLGTIEMHSISPELMFGFSPQNGIQVADSEKAYLDLLYYYVKGTRFVIDPMVEVSTSKLNRSKIEDYLTKYKNPKFVTLARRLVYE